jgi:hypothetical protein
MCDYSLCGLPTRLAIEGEELVVHKFQSGSIGLASPADLWPPKQPAICASMTSFWDRLKRILESAVNPLRGTVVCIPPGTQLLLRSVPENLQRKWNIAEEESAVFVQTSAEPHQYRDAIHFRHGPPVSLQNLRPGMRVQILSLGGESDDRDQEFVRPRYSPVGFA